MHPPIRKIHLDRIHIRWMIRRDMSEVLSIESVCYREPWNEERFLTRLRQRNCIGMVAECGEEVVGFMLYDLQKTNINLLNMAVKPCCQHQGVGSLMMAKLKGKLASHRRTSITATPLEPNPTLVMFLVAMGFEPTKCGIHTEMLRVLPADIRQDYLLENAMEMGEMAYFMRGDTE